MKTKLDKINKEQNIAFKKSILQTEKANKHHADGTYKTKRRI